MTEIKTWRLNVQPFEENDYKWITSIGCKLDIEPAKTEEITLPSGTRSRFVSEGPKITVETTCEKQQIMLQLRYGNSMWLYETNYC